uniref:Uncharacterized protein n=1 Tax=Arundo donax TaxID=35708 RepID=A0A0A9BIF3_ARUDO
MHKNNSSNRNIWSNGRIRLDHISLLLLLSQLSKNFFVNNIVRAVWS